MKDVVKPLCGGGVRVVRARDSGTITRKSGSAAPNSSEFFSPLVDFLSDSVFVGML